MQRVVIASILTAVAVGAWDYVFWTSQISRATDVDQHVSNESQLVDMLDDRLERSGYYVVGENETPAERASGEYTHAEIFFTKDGPSWYRADITNQMMVVALVTFFPVGMLLNILASSLPSFRERFLCVITFGAAAALWLHLPDLLLERRTLTQSLLWFFYDTVTWTIGGAILAGIIQSDEEIETKQQQPDAVV